MRTPYKKTRPAYCTGCGTTFPKMHQLRDHRHTFKCGGLWRLRGVNPLSIPEWLQKRPDGQSFTPSREPYPKALKTQDNGWKAINPSVKKPKGVRRKPKPVTKDRNRWLITEKRLAALAA